MQKICVIILLSALASNHEAVPQTKWSRLVRTPLAQVTRERRQFPFGEWIPLSQPCPTCRPFADPLEAALRGESIGLTPPKPPTVTRQIHGEGNFFPQDESSILSVPPPPPSSIPGHPIPNANGNFQFSTFGQSTFNAPLPVPTQKIFPQAPQVQFLPQTFLSNQPLLVNGNQQIVSGFNAQSNLFGHEQRQQQANNGKVAGFNSEFKSQKIPENVVLEQNKRPVVPNQVFPKAQPFAPQQQNQQTFVKQQTFNGQQQQQTFNGQQQQTFNGQQHQTFNGQQQKFNGQQHQAFGAQQQHSVNFENSILTPPPAPKNVSQDIVIPGLDKEEIQLLYVPVETLRQRGTPQEQLLTQQPQNIQFYNRQNGLQRPVNNNAQPTEQTIITQGKGHFITQKGNQGNADSSPKITSAQPFPTTVTPSTLLLQHLPFQQTPQPFVSATPSTPNVSPFVTSSPSVFQKFSPFTPETTLPHLSTVPNTIQFTQSDIEFGTTPKTVTSQGVFSEEIINGKPQFAGLKSSVLTQEGVFSGQQQAVTQQPQLSTVFSQEQLKEVVTPTHFPHQIDQQQITFQKQQQRQKELEEQRFLEQQRKQKELEEQRLLQQQQQRQKELEQQRFLQKQKELEEQRQKELEQQRFLQKQKELEEQRLLQQRRQKELEQQRFLQKQKELEEQRLLQQRQKELEEQRFLQEQRQKELENQRRLQLERQKDLEEKRRLQLKQKEEEARLLRFQQQQKEIEQQRLLQQKQQEEQQRILQQQKLQKQENLKKQQFQQFQQQQQQQKQAFPQQGNRHVLPANDNLNLIPQLEKESAEDQQLVPHQPPLSVFFKGRNGEAKITDVLRELRRSNTIIVLDQYFDKMPTVFVGPAGLIPPTGYGKFDLPYLSNIESNRIERRIDKLPFFVAPLNFIPPPGYAKIPFPAPHVGSVVVSSESNPAMNLEANGKGSAVEENSGSFPVVGPELPGLINSLDTITTTIKPTTYTPSLPQTTAQLRNRRPNNSVYKPQSRKPISRTRPTTTSKPEEEVTQPIQKVEATKEPEVGFRKPFNRFFSRRRQQAKTTTEAPVKSQQDKKSLENRHYSIDLLNQEKNQVQRTQQKSDVIREDELNGQLEHSSGSIDRITPGGQEVFEARPTPDFSRTSQIESEERHPELSEYVDVNLHSFEDGPLPTGSAKTITQEVYRPNAIAAAEAEDNSKSLSKPEGTQSSVQFQASAYEDVTPTKFSEISDATPTAGLVGYKEISSEGQVSVEPTSVTGYEKQEVSSERFDTTDTSREKGSYAPESGSGEQHKGFINSGEQYTSAFAEISKPHHIPGFVDPSRRQNSNGYTSQEISVDLEAPFPQNQQQYDVSGEVRPTNSAQVSGNKFTVTGSSSEEYLTVPEGVAKAQQSLDASTSHVSPTAPGATEGQYTTGFPVNSQGTPEGNRQYEDQRIGSFISVQDVQRTSSPQEYYSSSPAFPSPASATGNDYRAVAEKTQSHLPPTPETVAEVTANPSAQTYTSASEDSVNVSEQTTEGHGQEVANNLASDHRLKLPNPSIVRVRTRVRGKSRGQVNFAASQTTTQAPFIRSTVENRHVENTEQESTTKTTHFREYNPVKISKYNQYRGVKKPVRTTTEAAVEYEQKANVYTVRPHRRPLNPSTVSTKRIRRPTTPIPSVEAETEAFGISTLGSHSHSQSDISDISPSGVSNDVYYEQSSLSPVKHKFRKHFGQAEQKNDVVPAYVSTSHPSVAPTYSTFAQDAYTGESQVAKDLTHAEGVPESSEKYPEWNPSDSGFDVSGIVLTTVRTPGQEEQQQVEPEEPKKSQDSKKAFDPDLEKKTGRRRVRVRVHKRPHENFETAESQNLRTVANVLVPPTTTYKPNDESSFHQLAKNADFSFGGQKLFGLRSREYFRKRLNLTQIDDVLGGKGEQADGGESTAATSEAAEKPTGPKISGFLRKAQKNELESSQANETAEVGKIVRPKFRGFVRKIVKHTGVNKEADPEAKQVVENEEEKHENDELHSRQTFRVNQGFNHTGRVNGTRHKTLVRFVKKNKIRHQEPEAHEESTSEEAQKEEQILHQTTESHTEGPQQTESETTEVIKEEKKVESQFPEYHVTEETTQNVEPQQEITRETTEEAEAKQQVSTETTPTESGEAYESSSPVFQESSTPQSPTPLTQVTGLYLTQRPKFYQTLRPVFQRPIGFQRTKEPVSTTSTTEHSIQESHDKTSRTQETQEKRTGYTRYKYGKTTGYGSTGFASTANEKSDETKKLNEQQLKNKNLHTLEVRKYLRTKTREGAFSQFSKNKYFTSEKTETVPTTTRDQDNVPEEETTTERIAETSPVEPKTTEAVLAHTYSTEIENETTQNGEEQEPHAPTTEAVSLSEEETSEEEEEEVSRSATLETTTETEIPTTVYQASSSRVTEVTEPKTTIQTTESVEPQRTEYEPDIYRFSKHSFNFDETAQFTGTKNRAHVRNITTDIIENTASFSAPGVEKRPEIRVVTHRSDEGFTDSTQKEKTETTTTELNGPETTTTEYPETTETGTSTSTAEAATKAKIAKVLKTSTTTKISHETEICYRGKCIRTKSENPDEDLKLLVDSASTMKIEKTKRGT